MEIVLVWIVFSVVVAMVASSKGRSGIGYFFVALLISPLIGIIIALIVDPIEKNGAKKQQDYPDF